MEKYFTKDDYLAIKGINLSLELKNLDNPSDKEKRTIKEITDWCVNYLLVNYGANELLEWNQLPEWRQQRFINGCMEQLNYVLDNGRISKDSGINRQTGTILNLKNLVLDNDAYNEFFLGAFCNI